MNKKRWLAFAIALIIVVVNAIMPNYVVSSSVKEKGNSQLSILDDYLVGNNEIQEVVLENGSSDSRILLLSLNGVIAPSSGGLGGGYDHSFFLEQLNLAKEDPSVKAILFEVNTPGGGVFESAEIRRKLLELKEKGIPYYVSMQSMAASGGYYVSADADKIFATENTITGSIGVIMSMVNYKDLLDRIGVHYNTIASGNFKDMGSPTAEMTPEKRALFQGMIDDSYQRFVNIIAGGRKMTESQVKKLADGRIYTANQALENGLIDQIGYKEDALAALRSDYDLANSQLFTYQKDSLSSVMQLLSLTEKFPRNSSDLSELRLIMENFQMNAAPRPYYLYGGQ